MIEQASRTEKYGTKLMHVQLGAQSGYCFQGANHSCMVTPLNMVLGNEDSGILCTDQTQPGQAALTSEVEKNRQMQATSDTKRFWLSFDFNQNDARASRLLINYSQSIQFYPQTFCHLSNLFFSTTFELSKLVLKYKQPLPSSQGPHPTPTPTQHKPRHPRSSA